MRLIDEAEAVRLYGVMGPGREVSGGSAGNTAAGLAALGIKTGFIGQVADDQLGKIYQHDIEAQGIDFLVPARSDVGATARCLILVTPDAQRTMNTFLGAAQRLEAQGRRPGRRRRRRDHLPRRLSVGPGRAARGDGSGDRRGARRRAQGRLHAVGQLLHLAPPRQLPAS